MDEIYVHIIEGRTRNGGSFSNHEPSLLSRYPSRAHLGMTLPTFVGWVHQVKAGIYKAGFGQKQWGPLKVPTAADAWHSEGFVPMRAK